jgi:hypothetical protein
MRVAARLHALDQVHADTHAAALQVALDLLWRRRWSQPTQCLLNRPGVADAQFVD